MGSKPSSRSVAAHESPPRRGPPRQAVSVLDGAEKASDILTLTNQDAARQIAEAKDKATLAKFQQRQLALLDELRGRHAKERTELQGMHERRVNALYEECRGMLTQHELEDALGTAPGLLAFRWAGTAGAKSQGRAPAAAVPTDLLPQNPEHRRLAQLSMHVADSEAGQRSGVTTGLEVMTGLELANELALKKLKQAQARTLQAAKLKIQYDYTAKVLELEDRKDMGGPQATISELWEDHKQRHCKEVHTTVLVLFLAP